jgi:hypothetical protein
LRPINLYQAGKVKENQQEAKKKKSLNFYIALAPGIEICKNNSILTFLIYMGQQWARMEKKSLMKL